MNLSNKDFLTAPQGTFVVATGDSPKGQFLVYEDADGDLCIRMIPPGGNGFERWVGNRGRVFEVLGEHDMLF